MQTIAIHFEEGNPAFHICTFTFRVAGAAATGLSPLLCGGSMESLNLLTKLSFLSLIPLCYTSHKDVMAM